jgi:hypothetical protein
MVNTDHIDRRTPQFNLAPPAATALADAIGPAMTVTAVDDIRSADGRADHAANNRARRAGNDGTGTGADGNTFKRARLSGRERDSGKREDEQSRFDERAHNNLLG